MKTVVSVIGARPQFIKAAPIEIALSKHPQIKHFSVHTGQHYDANMSDVFFNELKLAIPYANLNVGSGSHAKQTAAILEGMESVFLELKPDMLIVYGDTNSTLAAALCAAKLNIPIAHIEAGLRSYNREMPEEINRVLTDHISTLLFAPSNIAIQNLEKEGVFNATEIGDVMLDMMQIATEQGKLPILSAGNYIYATLHRPYNTDSKQRLTNILQVLNQLNQKVIFPIHPRTRNIMNNDYHLKEIDYPNIDFIEPQGYFNNMAYLNQSDCLITDSGGMQKEAYFFKKRCITIRSETEWVETLENNCNSMVWDNLDEIPLILSQPFGPFIDEIYGNGDAADKIIQAIASFLHVD